MKKQNKTKRLRKKADKLWFQILIEKKPKCEICGKSAVQIHHFFPKGSYSVLRYDLENGISICQGCHLKHHAKGDPTIHQRVIEKRGEDWYNRLLEKSKQLNPSYKGIKYYQEIIKKLSTIST